MHVLPEMALIASGMAAWPSGSASRVPAEKAYDSNVR